MPFSVVAFLLVLAARGARGSGYLHWSNSGIFSDLNITAPNIVALQQSVAVLEGNGGGSAALYATAGPWTSALGSYTTPEVVAASWTERADPAAVWTVNWGADGIVRYTGTAT